MTDTIVVPFSYEMSEKLLRHVQPYFLHSQMAGYRSMANYLLRKLAPQEAFSHTVTGHDNVSFDVTISHSVSMPPKKQDQPNGFERERVFQETIDDSWNDYRNFRNTHRALAGFVRTQERLRLLKPENEVHLRALVSSVQSTLAAHITPAMIWAYERKIAEQGLVKRLPQKMAQAIVRRRVERSVRNSPVPLTVEFK